MTCETCRFAEPTVTDDEFLVMECRRFPPTTIVIDDDPMRLWPQVATGEWCGEFRPADAVTVYRRSNP